MQRFPRYCLLSTAVLAMTMLAISIGQRLSTRAAEPPSLDDWDIPALADHLKRAGLQVYLQSPRTDGVIFSNAFLTTTPKDWEELNRLGIDPGPAWMHQWRGIVHCERMGKGKLGPPNWEDHVLIVGPFLFCGDVELLERIRALLVPSDAPIAP